MRGVFVTLVRTPAHAAAVRLLVESVRTFAGEMADWPFWVFATDPRCALDARPPGAHIDIVPLDVPDALSRYPYGDKVETCSRAEELAAAGFETVVWFDQECLVVRPPTLFVLDRGCDAALRPVHAHNVGLSPAAPLDGFWRGVYAAVGIEDARQTVESFISGRPLRAYFNSHGFAFRPALGLCRRWRERFATLVGDDLFQAAACADERHRAFLFQAVLSAVLDSSLDDERVRLLPPRYNYPYNLHDQVPDDRRAAALDDVVCLTYEGRTLRPDQVADIEIREPLRSWLASRVR